MDHEEMLDALAAKGVDRYHALLAMNHHIACGPTNYADGWPDTKVSALAALAESMRAGTMPDPPGADQWATWDARTAAAEDNDSSEHTATATRRKVVKKPQGSRQVRIRRWCAENGIELAPSGPIPADIQTMFDIDEEIAALTDDLDDDD